ncbi:MAG: biopolymer transporter ExbD [Pirellulales bacterium]
MNWRRTSQRESTSDVNMTPMIDVIFLLMIFFVCTASFQIAEELLPTNLLVQGTSTEAPTAENPPLEQIVVRGQRAVQSTVWQVNDGVAVSQDQIQPLLRALAGIDRSLPVVLDVDGNVPLGEMIEVYDLCRAVGLDKVQFAASVEN